MFFKISYRRKVAEAQHISELREIIPDDFHIFLATFQALNDVKKSCFGFTLSHLRKITLKNKTYGREIKGKI